MPKGGLVAKRRINELEFRVAHPSALSACSASAHDTRQCPSPCVFDARCDGTDAQRRRLAFRMLDVSRTVAVQPVHRQLLVHSFSYLIDLAAHT